MLAGVTLKVCGLTSEAAAAAAADCGADYLGFNFYPKSPRYLPLDSFAALAARLPAVRRTAVVVEPTAAELAAIWRVGFDAFQIHFRPEAAGSSIAAWAAAVGAENLWLAPKLAPGAKIAAEWLGFANVFLLDTFQADGFGGSGRTGDWAQFARHRAAHPEKTWILSGGLNPKNIGRALGESGARFIDVNSGVETAPGIKDAVKLRAFADAVFRARATGV